MNNNDMSKLIDMLSKMDSKELQNGIAKANEIIQSGKANEVINKLKNQ